MSDFNIKVYFLGYNKPDGDLWQASVEAKDGQNVEWTNTWECYGNGKTIEEALASTGRQLEGKLIAEGGLYAEHQAKRATTSSG